jgi:hypothetical protein
MKLGNKAEFQKLSELYGSSLMFLKINNAEIMKLLISYIAQFNKLYFVLVATCVFSNRDEQSKQ